MAKKHLGDLELRPGTSINEGDNRNTESSIKDMWYMDEIKRKKMSSFVTADHLRAETPLVQGLRSLRSGSICTLKSLQCLSQLGVAKHQDDGVQKDT